MIPIELQNQKEEFVKNYMENIDKRFIRNMYVFKFIQKGKGVFGEIMAITRYVYKKSKKVAGCGIKDFIMTVKPKNSVLKQIRMLY